MKKILVFCGANKGNSPDFEILTKEVGQFLALENYTILYGGGSVGLMGVLADEALSYNGKVVGIITDQLMKMEVGHEGISEMIIVDTMQDRKLKMLEMADASLILPGGYGTLDELFEALTLSQLNVFRKPIGILNYNGFYDSLLDVIDKMVETGFVHHKNKDLFVVSDSIPELLLKMKTQVSKLSEM